jgi:hypothetical protein
LILLAGLVLAQFFLYAPSLRGHRVLLPLDYLKASRLTPAVVNYKPKHADNVVLSDQVNCFECWRRFAAGELRAGRIPLWDPYVFAGAPFAVLPTYSPFNLVYAAFPSPVTLAWIQLLKSVLAGAGAYLFFRRALGAGFWPAVLGAWCYPFTAFFVFWQGFYSTCTLAWFPWLLLAVDGVVRQPGGWAGPGVAAVTGLLLVSGQADVALQALVFSGLYGLGRLASMRPKLPRDQPVGPLAILTAAWLIGLLLSLAYLLPLIEYVQTGSRMAERVSGAEDRPPIGLAALPLLILPDAYGRSVPRTEAYVGPGSNQLESPAAGYVGLFATLVAAPLAWRRSERRGLCWLLAGLAFFALGWVLNVPGLVHLFRLRGINMMSGNRYVFASAFFVLGLAVLGLDGLANEPLRWRRWFLVPITVVVLAAGWCAVSLAGVTGLLGTSIPAWLPQVRRALNLPHQTPFVRTYVYGLALLGLALTALGLTAMRRFPSRVLGIALGTLMIGELLAFAPGRNPQCDPALYYPPLPVLEAIGQAEPGRSLGICTLVPNQHEFAGLRELRGYDAVDPVRMIAVLELAREGPNISPPYARTLQYLPALAISADHRPVVPAVLNMLNLRYLIFRGRPAAGVRPRFEGQGYFVLENPGALPRAFFPRRVETLRDDREVLARLAAPDFDPRAVAYIDEPLPLGDECAGTARITEDLPCRVTVRAEADKPGLLILADQWYAGWKATVNGEEKPVVIANYALRGVAVPAGNSEVVFRYEPRSFTDGARLSAAAGLALLAWVAWLAWRVISKSRVVDEQHR